MISFKKREWDALKARPDCRDQNIAQHSKQSTKTEFGLIRQYARCIFFEHASTMG